MIEIFISDIPPSNNRFIGQNKRWEYQKYKKDWASKVSTALNGQIPIKPIERAEVHIHYFFPDRRRRDPDNYSGKMLLDPLVKFGVLLDDSFKNVKLKLSAEVVPKVNKGTRITIIEI